MNLVVIIGNLARDPEMKYGQNNLAIAKFTVAVNRLPRSGEETGADFIRVTAFGKQAELIERYLSKGRKVAVEGRIQTGSYDKDGQKVYTTDVIANRVEFLGSKGEGTPNGSGAGGSAGSYGGGDFAGGGNAPQNTAGNGSNAQDVPSAFAEMDDDDLPF